MILTCHQEQSKQLFDMSALSMPRKVSQEPAPIHFQLVNRNWHGVKLSNSDTQLPMISPLYFATKENELAYFKY